MNAGTFAVPFRVCFTLFCCCLISGITASSIQAADEKSPSSCTREEFEAVVDEAGAALRQLNKENKPKFQNQLRQLKEKRGWSHEQFLKEAAPYVRDEQTVSYDRTSSDLLNEISTMGEEGAQANAADCALLVKLRARMAVLVKTQKEKWSYMFNKLDQALK